MLLDGGHTPTADAVKALVLRRSPKMTHPCSRKLAQASRTVCVGVGASFGRQW
jgi:hypothetical protein